MKKLIIFFILLLLPLAYISVKDVERDVKIGKMDEKLKLKTTKDKILSAEEIDEVVCVKTKCQTVGKVMKYKYISDKKVSKQSMIIDGKKVDEEKRTGNAIIFKHPKKELLGAVGDEKETYTGIFYYGGDQFTEYEGEWYEIDGATTTIEAFETQTEEVSLFGIKTAIATTTAFYYGAGDGNVASNNYSTWDGAHNATTGNGAFPVAATGYIYSGRRATGYFDVWRGFLVANTSLIGDTDTVVSATSSVKNESLQNADNDGDDFFVFVGPTTQATATTLSTADIDTCGTTQSPNEVSERKDIGTLTSGGFDHWVLNASGTSIISKTGYTMLGLREGHDVLDSAISSGVTGNNAINAYFSEQTGTADDPYLTITFESETPAATSSSPIANILIFE